MITGARTPLTVDLTGLRVAISAGAGGIGRVMADSFAQCGAEVFVSDIDAAALTACPYPSVRADAGVVARAIAIAWAHAPMSTFQLPMVKESIGWSAATGRAAADRQEAEGARPRLRGGQGERRHHVIRIRPARHAQHELPGSRPGRKDLEHCATKGR